MIKFGLGEISAVDSPAQTPALATIAKRDPAAELRGALLKLHDLTANCEKRAVHDLVTKTDSPAADLRLLARQLSERVKEEIDVLLAVIGDATGATGAEALRAMEATTHGEALLQLKTLAAEIEAALANAPDSLEMPTHHMKRANEMSENLLDKSFYDDFGNVKDPAAALAELRKNHLRSSEAVFKSNDAHEELEKRARKIAAEKGVGFYDAYEIACELDPALAARAVAQG
jgi:hypothetical protein